MHTNTAGIVSLVSWPHHNYLPRADRYAIWMENTEALFDRLSRTHRKKKDHIRVDLWVTGTVSPRVRQELLNRGIVARENIRQQIQLAD